MCNERGEDGPLDVILSMGRLSSEGDVYRVELEITAGSETGNRKEIEALLFPAGSGRFMILEKEASGGYGKVPNLAVYRPEDNHNSYIRPDGAAAVLRKSKRDRGIKRISLGDVRGQL